MTSMVGELSTENASDSLKYKLLKLIRISKNFNFEINKHDLKYITKAMRFN